MPILRLSLYMRGSHEIFFLDTWEMMMMMGQDEMKTNMIFKEKHENNRSTFFFPKLMVVIV